MQRTFEFLIQGKSSNLSDNSEEGKKRIRIQLWIQLVIKISIIPLLFGSIERSTLSFMSKHINVHVLRNIAQEHLIYIYWLAYKNERTLSVKGQTTTSAEVLTVFYAEWCGMSYL